MAPFVLFCTPRTGSYHFVSLLASAPDVDCHGEAFKPGRVELAPAVLAALGMGGADAAARDADPLGFVERLRALTPPERAFGFKLFSNHVAARKVLRDALLWAPAWRKIVLDRDPLATYASLLRAERTGVWTLQAGRSVDAALLNAPVRFEAEGFAKHLQQHAKFRRQVEAAAAVPGNPLLELDYDRLVHGDGLAAALRFIGSSAEAASLTSSLRRQFDADLRAGFANWPEVEAYLRAKGMRVPPERNTTDSPR